MTCSRNGRNNLPRVDNCYAVIINRLRQRFQATEVVRNNVEDGYIELYHDIWTSLYVTYTVKHAFDLSCKSVIRNTGIHRKFYGVFTSLVEVLLLSWSFES